MAVSTGAQHPLLINYSTTDYHGGTQNWCIDMTPDNRILFANNNGLIEFDSDVWQMFYIGNYSSVRSVMFDHLRDVVWVGGSGEFGYFAQRTSDFAIEYHSLSARARRPLPDFGEVWHIMQYSGKMWFQAKEYLFAVDTALQMKIVHTPFLIECSAVVDGRLLLAARSGLYAVDAGGRVSQLSGCGALAGTQVRGILPYGGGRLLLVTATDGLFVYDGTEATPLEMDITPYLKNSQAFCTAMQNKLLAVGTVSGGLVLKNLETGQVQYANMSTGLQNNTVLSLRFDEKDNIWLGLDQGAAYVMPSTPYSNMLGAYSQVGTGYASLATDGCIYLGTNQGLFTIPDPMPKTPAPPVPQRVGGLTGQVWTLDTIGGRVLCGADGGAYVVSGQSARRIAGVEGTWKFIAMSGTDGLVLCCDYKGLIVLRPTAVGYEVAWRIRGFSETTGAMIEDNDGTIWMSHWQKGVYHLTLSPDRRMVVRTTLYNKANQLLTDDNNQICRIDGRVYISAVDGFHYLNHQTGRLEHVDRLNSIFSTYGTSLRIWETPAHDLWAYKPGYLAIAHRQRDGSYNVDTLSYKGIRNHLQLGLGNVSFRGPARTIVSSNHGFYMVNNNYVPRNYPPTRLLIQSILATSPRPRGPVSGILACPISQPSTYTIDHSQNSIRISFVMPEYANPHEIVYACKLEGYDGDWGIWQTGHFKEYTRLPKGNYTFRVKARNRITGKETETAVRLLVLPAWYETWWARLAYFLFACIAVWGLWRLVKSRQDRRVHEMEAKKELQLRQQQERFEMQQQRFEMEQTKKENELARMRNEQLQVELKHRQSELADSTMNLMRKNDMLQALDTQMDELSECVRREDPKNNITKKIKDIRHDIQQNINEDDNWEKFEQNFNLVYDNYMIRLTARFPELKMNERKLCAYLRMGLSSKEMAALLNSSVRSIETARYRLRKKLGIEQGHNLTEFLQA